MSDDSNDDNYDEFMYSEDEDMGTDGELAFESDNDSDIHIIEQEEVPVKTFNFQEKFNSINALLDQGEHDLAKEQLVQLSNNPNYSFNDKINADIMIVKVWSFNQQLYPDENRTRDLWKQGYIALENIIKLHSYITETQITILLQNIDELLLGGKSQMNIPLIFNISDEIKENIKRSGTLESTITISLDDIITDTKQYDIPWIITLKRLIEFKRLYMVFVKCSYHYQIIETKYIVQLQELIDILSQSTEKKDSVLLVKALELILQGFLSNFLLKGASNHETYRKQFESNIHHLQIIVSDSLSLQQDSKLMLILHLCSGINYLPRCERYDEEEVDEHDIQDVGSKTLTNFVDRISNCRNEFLTALNKLDEIGLVYNHESLPGIYKLILSVFVMTSMILVKLQKINIDPFNFEQVQIHNKLTFFQLLRDIYDDWVEINIEKLFHDLCELDHFLRITLQYFIDKILQLSQTMKLWFHIAPNYNCLSIEDLSEQLTYNIEYKVTRDEVLTILMRSIMRGKAIVYYKIDFINDLIYFGDENKRPLTRKMTMTSHSYQPWNKTSNVSKLSEEYMNLEYANDVSVFNIETKHIVANSANSFLNQMKQNRNDHYNHYNNNTSTTPNVKQLIKTDQIQTQLHENYLQLVEMAKINIETHSRETA